MTKKETKEEYCNRLQDEKINSLEGSIRDIKENDLAHIQADITKISTDMDWIKRFFWIVASASLGSLIATLFNLMGK